MLQQNRRLGYRLKSESKVALVAARISVVEVMQCMGFEVEQPSEGTSIKTYCPFTWLHPDGKATKGFRLYGDGGAYCFIEQQRYDSVSVASLVWDCTPTQAATRLAQGQRPTQGRAQGAVVTVAALSDLAGVIGPGLNDLGPQTIVGPSQRVSYLAALQTWCSAVPARRSSPAYCQVLDLLDCVSTVEQAQQWLAAAKQVLGQVDTL